MLSRKEFRPLLVAGICIAAGMLAADVAAAGLKVGARIGYADYKGDIFVGSGDLGETRIIGAQVIFPLLSRLEIELAGEGSTESVEFTDAGVDDLFDGKAEWNDIALYSSARLHLLPLAGLIGVYIGGGLGVHFTEVDVESLDAFSEAVEEYVAEVEEDRSDLEWNALAGASLGLGAVPLELFVEGRYRDITGDDGPEALAIYGGVNIKLQ